jgi:hypothetical protein
MKIRLLGLGLILAATTTVSAQKYSFETVNREVYTFTDTTAHDMHLRVKNNTASTLPLSWKILYNTLDANRWEATAFCDPSLCYYKLYASLDSFAVIFYETGSSVIDTLTYIIDARTVGIGNLPEYGGRLNLYPNPAVNNINLDLKGSLTVAIYDMKGQIILSQLNAGQRISVEALKPGMYMIQAVSGNKIYMAQFEKR